MKNLRTAVLCAVMALGCLTGFSQEKPVPVNEPDLGKPRLFDGLPDKISINTDEINALLGTQAGRPAQFRMTADAARLFEGEVVSTAGKAEEGLQTVVMRSTNFNGARMTLSRVTLPDGSITYSGRILSFKHGDLYVLQLSGGEWSWVKKNYYDLVNE